jgi:uncharacterized sulfatase
MGFRSRILALSILAAAVAPSPLVARSAEAPNVVLIISDDQGYGDYSFMGHPHVRTPHLDELALQSLVFRRGYVPSSLCSPSLATILTGLYPHQHKITSNDPPLPAGLTGAQAAADPVYRRLRQELIAHVDRVPTVPRLLGDKGYLSLQTGKWWLGDFARGGFTHGMSTGDPDEGGRHGDRGLEIGRQGLKPVEEFIDLARTEGRPFFVWYAPMLPHQPHNPPQRFVDHYTAAAPTPAVAKYWAMCEWFDETCGQLLDLLETRKVADNTIVVYVTDNGWIQDPERNRYAPRSKQSPYDGGLRTPIMIRWPGRVSPGSLDSLASSIDVAPTILAATGVEPPPGLPGANLLDEPAVRERQAIHGEIFTHNAVDVARPDSSLRFRWIVKDRWKLIVPGPNEPDSAVELFDVSADPAETRNLAAGRPEVVEELSAALDRWWPGESD